MTKNKNTADLTSTKQFSILLDKGFSDTIVRMFKELKETIAQQS